ncbi:MAG: PLP-dependent aspartate aminotransferase family protein [Gemmatimonadales bacterium]|nr:PLP-dependent transferase [Gemmatimonadota bacterium]MCL4214531.1 PLP-dependent aspartate aminotransferase family protein [Gemmatimonadales bacterium]
MPRQKPKPSTARHSLATLAIHGGREAHRAGDPVVGPLVQSVNHLQALGTADGLKYTRYGNTPNAERLQKRLALLEGAEASLVLSSGMGATACALLALLRPGDHLLSSMYIYGGTHRLFLEEFASMGIEVTLVDPFEPRSFRKRVKKETRAIFVESPVNPTCRVIDLRPLSYLTKEEGLALVVDSTFASPVNFRPIEIGADVVIHSATKYLNGHHDVLAGVVSGSQPYIEEVLQKEMLWGQTPDPFALWLLERGLKTLDVRVKRANDSAMAIAEWASGRKEVKAVHYPGLPSHEDHKVASELLDGFGGMLALELSGGGKAADRFLRKLRLVTHAPSLGGVDTLVCEPRYTSHAKMTSAERARIGIPDGFLRLSIGLEDPDDLIADLEQALK